MIMLEHLGNKATIGCFGFVFFIRSTYYREVSKSSFLCDTGKKMINAALFCFTGLLQDSDNPYSRFENE